MYARDMEKYGLNIRGRPKCTIQKTTQEHTLFWVGVQGGLFLENFRGVSNFWVLLHFYALISKIFQISVGLRGGGTRLQHQSPGGSVPPAPSKITYAQEIPHSAMICINNCYSTSGCVKKGNFFHIRLVAKEVILFTAKPQCTAMQAIVNVGIK